MNFTEDTIATCADAGIDIERSYAHMQLEVRLGGPSLDRLLASVDRPNAKTRFAAKHGTLSGYTSLKCRCQWCRAASAAYQRQKRAQRRNAA